MVSYGVCTQAPFATKIYELKFDQSGGRKITTILSAET
jgi:hypothetical protein